MTIDQTLHLAQRRHQAGQLAEAEALYRQVLAIQPNHADALHWMGVLASNVGRHDVALDLIGRAVALQPDAADTRNDLGNAFHGTGEREKAIACYRQAIALRPDFPDAYNNLGISLGESGALEESAAAFSRAIELRPEFADAHNGLGRARSQQGRLAESAAALRQALALRPDHARAAQNLADVFLEQWELDQAIEWYHKVLALRPDAPQAQTNLGVAYYLQGDISKAVECYDRALAADPNDAGAASCRVFTLQFHPDSDPQSLLREQRAWDQRYAQPLRSSIAPHENDRSPKRRLKIGYVSPDFRRHVLGGNLLPLFAEHDHQQFEIFCYASVTHPDDMTERFRSRADVWRDILDLSDEKAAQLIRGDGIDILVDLSLHSARNRLLIFARKPAPVQVTFAGYPGGTGLETMDWRLTDPYLDPPGESDANYVERSYRLPNSFWCCNTRAMEMQTSLDAAPMPPPSALPALNNGYVTFGCLNNFCKINAGVLALWSQVLHGTPRSRLRLLAPPGEGRRRVLHALQNHDVDPGRVDFVTRQPRPKYVAEFARIDIGLDTLPYGGHTSSLDSMYMGVPVISKIGRTVVGRAGWSHLSNLKLTELAAWSDEQFVQIATDLAGDWTRLAELRTTLRQRMLDSPLGDAKRFTRDIEAAYRQLWKKWI